MGDGSYSVKLPPFLTADIEHGERPRNSYWREPVAQFIVLKFGYSEIARWEWQADRPVSARDELEDDDVFGYAVTDFVAEKLREMLFPKESTKED